MRQQVRELLEKLEIDAPDSPVIDQAFRHKSMGRDVKKSYEALERLGDSVIRSALLTRALQRNDILMTPSALHAEGQRFWVNKFFAWVSVHYGLYDVMKCKNGKNGHHELSVSLKRKADLVESFIAALHMVGGHELSNQGVARLIFPHYDAAYAGGEYSPVALLRHFYRLERRGGLQFRRQHHGNRTRTVSVLLNRGSERILGEGKTMEKARLNAVCTVLDSYYGIS